MKHYRKIPFWENTRRIRFLEFFRTIVMTYFQNTYPGQTGGFSEKDIVIESRREINKRIVEAMDIIRQSGNSTTVNTGQTSIDLFEDMFQVGTQDINGQTVIDIIDRSIGVYESDRLNSRIRTFNPFFILGEISQLLMNLPFMLIDNFGYDAQRMKNSSFGRFIRFLIHTSFTIIILAIILHFFGLLVPVINAALTVWDSIYSVIADKFVPYIRQLLLME